MAARWLVERRGAAGAQERKVDGATGFFLTCGGHPNKWPTSERNARKGNAAHAQTLPRSDAAPRADYPRDTRNGQFEGNGLLVELASYYRRRLKLSRLRLAQVLRMGCTVSERETFRHRCGMVLGDGSFGPRIDLPR